MEDLMRQLTSRAHFNSIIAYIARQTKELVQGNIELLDDHLISKLADRLLVEKYKEMADENQFKTYELMGYYKEFSEVAHRNIERNNINGEPFKNAYILKNLGNFY